MAPFKNKGSSQALHVNTQTSVLFNEYSGTNLAILIKFLPCSSQRIQEGYIGVIICSAYTS
jgi:hypothetical protein